MTANNPERQVSSAKTRGNFFAVDCRSWAQVCTLGMNAAVAYLLLGRFSQRDNRTTLASVQAIETHTGISRSRAGRAIEALIASKLIKRLESGKRPRYHINPHPRGNRGSSKAPDPPQWIWLPNEFVTAAVGEPSPVERLRQTQDVMALRLAVDLYYAQNLREDGGISRLHILKRYERIRVGQQGPYTVWGFRAQCLSVWWTELMRPHYRDELSQEELEAGANEGVDLFMRFAQLERLGLIEWVPYLIEGESTEAELIHPYHGELADCAHEAASMMLTEGQRIWASERDFLLAPVPHHIAEVQMVGVARLRYRPKTSATAAWWADYDQKCAEYRVRYKTMLGEGTPDRQNQRRLAASR